jgi:hypothetical protein
MQAQVSNVNKSIKFTFQGEIRRFTLTPDNQNLPQMTQVIRSLIHQDEMALVIKYLDDENEWVTMDRDIEFETAMSMTDGVLRLDVSEGLKEQAGCTVKGKRGMRGMKGCGKRGSFKGRGRRGGCGRGRKGLGNEAVDVAEDETAVPHSGDAVPVWGKCKRRGTGPGMCKKGKWKGKGRRFADETTSDSTESVDPSLSVPELKAQIQKLVDSMEVARNNVKEANEKLAAKKTELVQSRQNSEITPDQISALRAELAELKTAKIAVRGSLWATKREIGQLRKAIRAKQAETAGNPSDE